jgi:hypothetical protein
LAGILQGNAQDWYDSHVNNIECIRRIANWKAFSSAMKECDTNILLKKIYLDILHNQVYDGNNQAYLIKIDNLNMFIRLKSLEW